MIDVGRVQDANALELAEIIAEAYNTKENLSNGEDPTMLGYGVAIRISELGYKSFQMICKALKNQIDSDPLFDMEGNCVKKGFLGVLEFMGQLTIYPEYQEVCEEFMKSREDGGNTHGSHLTLVK